jgi:ABC-type nitrate/sulfonate/bicarbonate transport system substrate-binding protein
MRNSLGHDFGLNFATVQIGSIDCGVAMKVLAGVHVGCFELFVNDAIGGITDFAGKKVGIRALGSPEHLFVSVIVANVGIDPKSQIDWVTSGPVRPKQLFIDGKIDAFLGFPPEPQELRGARRKRPPATKVQLDPMPGSFIHFLANHVVRRMIDPDRIVTAIHRQENFPRCRTRCSRRSITRSGH